MIKAKELKFRYHEGDFALEIEALQIGSGEKSRLRDQAAAEKPHC